MKTPKPNYEIKGWTWHWVIFLNGAELLNEKGSRFWFTRKVAAEDYIKALKKAAREAAQHSDMALAA